MEMIQFIMKSRIILILLLLAPIGLNAGTGTQGKSFESPPKNYKPQKQGDFSSALDCKRYPASGIMITDWFFGKFKNTYQHNEKAIMTRTIPYLVNQNYGFRIWMIANKGHLPKMSFRESLVPPIPVPNWKKIVAHQPWIKVAPDNGAAYIYHTQNKRDRRFMYESVWVIVKEDPKGPWYVEIAMNGKKICRFDFEVK